MAEPLRAAILGCGDVAGRYAKTLARHSSVTLHAAADRNPERARALAGRFGAAAYGSLDDLLDDDAVDLVVNLTRQSEHAATTAACLRAAKHVYSEKPLALSTGKARELIGLACRHGVRLACAPAIYLGEAQSRAWRLVRGGAIGPVRAAYAEANWGRIEAWHPRPSDFYKVGPMFDVGIYPISLLTAMFGPVVQVRAYGRLLLAERRTRCGEPVSVTTPDLVVACLDFAAGPCARVTASFYAPLSSKQHGIELHGDSGSLFLDSWHASDAGLELAQGGSRYEPLPVDDGAYHGTDLSCGLAELARAIREARPHRNPAQHAAHVIEVVEMVHKAITTGRAEAVFVPEDWDAAWPTLF